MPKEERTGKSNRFSSVISGTYFWLGEDSSRVCLLGEGRAEEAEERDPHFPAWDLVVAAGFPKAATQIIPLCDNERYLFSDLAVEIITQVHNCGWI